MATTVKEFGISPHRTVFSGSSEEDVAYAKSFWQSIQLQPPIESRLVSSDIKQRLKVAPPGHQSVNVTYPAKEEPPELAEFLAKAKAQERLEQVQKLDRFSALRQEDIALLHKHREARKQVEKISNHKGLKPPPPEPVLQKSDDEDDDIQGALQDIDKFEKEKNLHGDSDSD